MGHARTRLAWPTRSFCTTGLPAMTAGVASCIHLLHTPSLWLAIAAPGGYILLGSARVSTGEEQETREAGGL